MKNMTKDQTTTASFDLCIEGDDREVVAESTRWMNLAKQAGIFSKLDDPGVNGWPTLYLRGSRNDLIEWIRKNYDNEDPETYVNG